MSVLISMLVGSKLSKKILVERSILSIIKNIGTDDFLLVVGVSPLIGFGIRKCIQKIKLIYPDHIRIITDHCSTATGFHNYIFLKYGTTSKWFIISHDDIELKTMRMIDQMENSLKNFTDIGWISFTDDDYLNRHWAPSTREGFHSDYLYEDAWLRRKMWQFHLLEEGYWKIAGNLFSNLNYDFPTSPVKCHAPFCHFIAIKSEKAREIGLWETWSTVSLLADEDQGLTALQKGLVNIWIPDIVYTHFRMRRNGGTRSWPIIVREREKVHGLFTKKWGFSHPPSKEDLKKIKREYGNTNIVWSFDRKSFEWDYLK